VTDEARVEVMINSTYKEISLTALFPQLLARTDHGYKYRIK
jgi:hypothetical protein